MKPATGELALDVVCRGSDYEVGAAIGAKLREKIHWAYGALPQFDTFRTLKPWWMPLTVFQLYASWSARRQLEPAFIRRGPEIIERLRGMSEGASVCLETLYLLQAMETANVPLDDGHVELPSNMACTTVALRGRRTATGKPIIAHNFDSVDLVKPSFVLRSRQGNGQRRSLEFTVAPLSGVIDGVNEHGLCIAYNFAMSADLPRSAPPLSLLIDDALSHCRTVREAIRRIRFQPRCGSGILMLADASGDIASLELSRWRSRLRRPKSGCDYLFHSNQFQCRGTRKVQIPADAIYGSSAPESLRGQRALQSAEQRDQRIGKLLGDGVPHDENSLASLMADHGAAGSPDGNTVCMHGNPWSTTACVQFLPAARRMRVAYDTACQAKFTEMEL